MHLNLDVHGITDTTLNDRSKHRSSGFFFHRSQNTRHCPGTVQQKEYIISSEKENSEPPAVREGLIEWVKAWHEDFDANSKAAAIIVDAMARYAIHLNSQGASPRKMSAVYDDLNAAGILVMMYDAPKGKNTERILSHFYFPPWDLEFRKKFSDSPNAIARYKRNLKDFSRFLQDSGMLPQDDEE